MPRNSPRRFHASSGVNPCGASFRDAEMNSQATCHKMTASRVSRTSCSALSCFAGSALLHAYIRMFVSNPIMKLVPTGRWTLQTELHLLYARHQAIDRCVPFRRSCWPDRFNDESNPLLFGKIKVPDGLQDTLSENGLCDLCHDSSHYTRNAGAFHNDRSHDTIAGGSPSSDAGGNTHQQHRRVPDLHRPRLPQDSTPLY